MIWMGYFGMSSTGIFGIFYKILTSNKRLASILMFISVLNTLNKLKWVNIGENLKMDIKLYQNRAKRVKNDPEMGKIKVIETYKYGHKKVWASQSPLNN